MDIAGNIKYGLTDRPPLFNWFILSVQQIFILASYFAVVLLVYRTGNYSNVTIAHLLSIAMFALAISSILQAIWKGPIGSGFFAMPVNSAIYLIPSVLVFQQAGIPGLIAMTVFADIIELLLSFVIKYVHFIFTPAVVGSMIALIGFELCVVGFQLMFSINVPLAVPRHLALHAIVAAIALIIMIVSTIPIANEKVGNNLVFTIAQNNGITQL